MRRFRTDRVLCKTLKSRFVVLCGLNPGDTDNSGIALRFWFRAFIAQVSRIVEIFNVSLDHLFGVRFWQNRIGDP